MGSKVNKDRRGNGAKKIDIISVSFSNSLISDWPFMYNQEKRKYKYIK